MTSAGASAAPAVLFLVETPGQFTELERLSWLLHDRRQARQIYLVYDCGSATSGIVKRIEAAGATCANASRSQAGMALREATNLPFGLGRFIAGLRSFLHLPILAARFRRFVRKEHIELVVVAEDNVSGRSRALVATADRLGIRCLLVPFTIVNPAEAAAALHSITSHFVRRLDQRILAALAPRWVKRYRGRDLLRLPAANAGIIELLGLAPPDPWIENRGPATITVESRAMQQRYARLGIEESQLVLTGTLVDSVLEAGMRDADERRGELVQRYRLPNRPILLCALPPDQFGIGRPAECEYEGYPQLLSAWLSALATVADTFTIVIRPHPRTAEADVKLLHFPGMTVVSEDTAALVPLCDLYVAAASATIRWAIGCGKPVLNFDIYRYGFDDYAGVPGLVSVDNVKAFVAALADLSSGKRLLELTTALRAVSSEWACLDGGSEGRILALYDRLLEHG